MVLLRGKGESNGKERGQGSYYVEDIPQIQITTCPSVIQLEIYIKLSKSD